MKIIKIGFATNNEKKVNEINNALNEKNIENIKFLSLKDLGYKNEIIEDGKTFTENSFIKSRNLAKHFGIPFIGEDSGLIIEFLHRLNYFYKDIFNELIKYAIKDSIEYFKISKKRRRNLDFEEIYKYLNEKNIFDFWDNINPEIEDFPGILSKRFCNLPNGSIKNIFCISLLNTLERIPRKSNLRIFRFALYHSVITYCEPDPNNKEKIIIEKAFEGKLHGNIGSREIGENGFGFDPIFYIKQKKFDINIPTKLKNKSNISIAQLPIEEKNKISHRGLALNKLLQWLKEERIK